MQSVRKIAACENTQAQASWTGPAIDPCPAPAAFLCQRCGWMLCGAHAGGHAHEAEAPEAFEQQVAAQAANDAVESATKRAAAAEARVTDLGQQLASAHAAAETLGRIRELLG